LTDRVSAPRAGEPAAPAPRPRRLRRWLRWLIALPFLFLLASVLQVATLRFVDPPFSAFMMIRQLEAWGSGDFGFRIAHDWRDLEEMSSNVPVALVASEDQNFAEHFGFDLKAIEKARKNNARGRKVRGGSTISQQTAKNLFLWSGRSWIRKGVNFAEFGDGVYGAQAAARTYYRKDARQLGVAEAARMAAVLPNPKRYSISRPGPYVQRRAGAIQRQMRSIGGNGYLKQIE
jgi:monofunctional biosynthetic peptidoglycan transglycosylase